MRQRRNFLLPTEIAILAYLLAISVLVVIFDPQLPGWWRFLLLHLGIASSILFVASLGLENRAYKFFRSFYPYVLVFFLFRETANFVHLIYPDWKSMWLVLADFKLLGGHPTAALEKISNPYLTEFLEFVYFSFYLVPFFGLWVYLRQPEKNFQVFSAHYFIALFIAYLIFPFVPAEGPWKTLAGQQTIFLEGKWIFRQVNDFLHHQGGIAGGCFPSTHLSAATAVLFAAARWNKKLFFGTVVWFALLFFSTIYGRYHYVVDGLAGMATGALAFAISVWLAARAYPETVPAGRDEETR